jgi:hypothetical protein
VLEDRARKSLRPGERRHARPKTTLSSVGAPTEEIAQWMLSPDPAEKLKAARAAIEYFDIKGDGYTMFYSPHIDDFGTMNLWGNLEIGPDTFYSWSDLGVTLGHEIEVHLERQFKINGNYTDIEEYYMREIEAERYEISNASRFGLSDKQLERSRDLISRYYHGLSEENRRRVDRGLYDVP